MSAETIARWNVIPMTRPEHDGPSTQFFGTKRPREDHDDEHDQDVKLDGEESDDDISLISRSPSPVPQDQMDIDKYDDYVRGPVREVITVDTKIKSTNKGFEILSKLGWVEGQPLGLSQDARIDPIPFSLKNDATGLGKTSQDFRVIETTVAQRRELDSERQRNETEEQRRAREGNVARRAALQTEISEVLRPFYCIVCDKQFQNVAQYDEHTNSYAHHHKIRFRDMQNTQRAKQNTPEEKDKRKEKERKREEKELRKIAAAAGVRMTKPTPGAAAPSAAPSTESKPTSFKKSGWATISSATAESAAPRVGWAAVGSSSVPSYSPPLVPDGISTSGTFPTTTARATALARSSSPPRGPPAREQVQDDQRQLHQPAPAFRTGGWSSIDSTTGVPPPPPLPPNPPLLAPSDVPMSAVMTDVHSQQEHRPAAPVSAPTTSAVVAAMATDPSPFPAQLRPQAPIANPDVKDPKSFKSKKEKETEMREHSRSGWQSFQKGGRRK